MKAVHRSSEGGAADDGVSTFVQARSRMLAVAFRTLGNAAEAEDIVQDVWLRWQNVDRDGVRNAPAFLTTTTLRLAINRTTAARARRETPLDVCRGEPLDPQAGPGIRLEHAQGLEAALLLLFEKLSPMERAAYLLREAFNYSYRHIARVVGVSEANGRQLVMRARRHLPTDRRVPVGAIQLRRIASAFIEATQKGDLAGLEAVLSADIVDSVASKAALRRPATAARRCGRSPERQLAGPAFSRSVGRPQQAAAMI